MLTTTVIYGVDNFESKGLNFNLKLNDNNINNSARSLLYKNNGVNNSNFNVTIYNKNDQYEARGNLILNGITYYVIAEGAVERFSVRKENDITKGLFIGDLYKDGIKHNEVIFDIIYETNNIENATTSMTIGVVNNISELESLSLNFGVNDSQLKKEYFEKYLMNNAKMSVSDNAENKIAPMSITPDYDLRKQSFLNSNSGALIYFAGYHATQLNSHGVMGTYAKAWTNSTNIENYVGAKTSYGNIVSDSFSTGKVEFDIILPQNFQASSPVPFNQTTSFNMMLPVYTKLTGFSIIEIPITTAKSSFTASGSPDQNNAKWVLTRLANFKNTNALSTSPWFDNNENGIGVKCSAGFQASVSSNTNAYVNYRVKFYCSVVVKSGTGYDYIYENLELIPSASTLQLIP